MLLSVQSLPPFIQLRPLLAHPSNLKEPPRPLQLHSPTQGAVLVRAASKPRFGLPLLLLRVCVWLLSQHESTSAVLQAAHQRLIFAYPRTDGIVLSKSDCWRSFRR